jgi:lipopolysaccharide export system protein LptA
MKPRFRFLCLFALGVSLHLRAQLPPEAHISGTTNVPSITRYRDTPTGPALDFTLSGKDWNRLTAREVLVTPFELKSYHGGQSGQIQFIVQGPESHIDIVSNTAWDAGYMELFTPATNLFTNLFVQGQGFFFTQADHLLIISNQTETRVLRALLRTSMMGQPQSNASVNSGEILKIFSRTCRFSYLSNHVDYAGGVHVLDPQMDLTSQTMSVQFNSNSAIQTILANGNVVITTTNKGRATGQTAFYYITNGSEITDLSGDATWQNGDQRAIARKFIYDSTRHLLSAAGHVRVWWPNAAPTPDQRRTGAPPRADDTGVRELFADFATLQFPPTNGPLESMVATGNVVIVNQADATRATADQAVYTRTNDLFELTGNPVWWNDQMEVEGTVLIAQLTNKIYHARGQARLKLKTSASGPANTQTPSGRSTNQWLIITSADLDYQTNLAVFRQDVQARLLENGALRDTLACDLLNVELVSNQVAAAVAIGNVRGQTAPGKTGVVKTIVCDILTAHRSPATGLMKDVRAESNVVIRVFGSTLAAPSNTMSAVVVTARFSSITNQIEETVAEQNVVFDQVKSAQTLHATGRRAVYAAASDQIKLTGQPFAITDKYIVSDADYLIWQSKTNRFGGGGPYKINLIKSPARPPSP